MFVFSGPGCSSIGGGAFTELGPFFPRGDGRGLVVNKHSWNRGFPSTFILSRKKKKSHRNLILICLLFCLLGSVSNLLFVESPAGVGWSYSNRTSDYKCGDHQTGMCLCILYTSYHVQAHHLF